MLLPYLGHLLLCGLPGVAGLLAGCIHGLLGLLSDGPGVRGAHGC